MIAVSKLLKEHMTGYIYKIVNLTNGKFYVGSTVDTTSRFRKHRRLLNTNKHHCPHLQAAWNRYGSHSFVFWVVEEVALDKLNTTEQLWLDAHHGKGQCYNHAKYVDNGTRGVKHTAKHIEAIKHGLKSYYTSNDHHAIGKKHSEASIALMRANRAGIPVTEAHKLKLREANLGKTASAETRAKLSAVHKGRVKTAEHIAQYNKAIVELTSGKRFESVKAVKEYYGIRPETLNRVLKSGKPLSKGVLKGLHFAYASALRTT